MLSQPSTGTGWRSRLTEPADPSATIEQLAEARIARLEAAKSKSAKDYATKYRRHVIPAFGPMKPSELETRHVVAWIHALREAYYPRTVHATHGALHVLLEEAKAAGLCSHNPSDVPRGTLPKKTSKQLYDKDAEVMLPEELGRLLSAEIIPEWRRVFYALLFLTGARVGEIAALRWRDWDRDRRPLGCLTMELSWSDKRKEHGTTKTEQIKRIPVHPLLEEMLVYWHSVGFERTFLRTPRMTDFLTPRVVGRRTPDVQTERIALERFGRDMHAIGMKPRRLHAARHTFITLMHRAKANPLAVREMTHPTEDESDSHMIYVHSVDWPALCEAISLLIIPI